MAHVRLSNFVYDCNQCHTRCDGISKGVYNFNSDAAFSEQYEQQVIDRINFKGKHLASKCRLDGYPDIEVRNPDGTLALYIEVKVQQRTFMNVVTTLPEAGLTPSETLALNQSDLLRYFEIEERDRIPVYILWTVLNRPCIVPAGQVLFYSQTTRELKKIFEAYGNKRRFRRKSGTGDVVEGRHKGVVVNYHFSISELREWC